MAEIKFLCPNCSHQIKTDASFAGQAGTCPFCGEDLTVPPEHAESPVKEVRELRELRRFETALAASGDAVADWMRFLRGRQEPFLRYQRSLSNVGAYSVAVAGGLYALGFLAIAIRTGRPGMLAGTAISLAAAFFFHYVSSKFAMAGASLMRHNPLDVPNAILLDGSGLKGLVLLVLSLVLGIWAVATGFFPMLSLLCALACVLLAFHQALFCLNPAECLNIRISADRQKEGASFLVFLAFLARFSLAFVPLCTALTGVIGAALAAIGVSGPMFFWAQPVSTVWLPADAFFVPMAGGVIMAFLAGAIPWFGYLGYIFLMFVVDAGHSVLSCGSKQQEHK